MSADVAKLCEAVLSMDLGFSPAASEAVTELRRIAQSSRDPNAAAVAGMFLHAREAYTDGGFVPGDEAATAAAVAPAAAATPAAAVAPAAPKFYAAALAASDVDDDEDDERAAIAELSVRLGGISGRSDHARAYVRTRFHYASLTDSWKVLDFEDIIAEYARVAGGGGGGGRGRRADMINLHNAFNELAAEQWRDPVSTDSKKPTVVSYKRGVRRVTLLYLVQNPVLLPAPEGIATAAPGVPAPSSGVAV